MIVYEVYVSVQPCLFHEVEFRTKCFQDGFVPDPDAISFSSCCVSVVFGPAVMTNTNKWNALNEGGMVPFYPNVEVWKRLSRRDRGESTLFSSAGRDISLRS